MKGKTMKTGMARTLAFVFALALTTVILAESSKVQERVWKIGSRRLPVPAHVSEVMQESLLKTPVPDVEAAKKSTPQKREQWEAFIKEKDTHAAAGVQALAEQLSVTVVQESIDGVNVYRVTPADIDAKHKNHLFVHLHGGAYVLNSGVAGTAGAVLIAARTKMAMLSIDYRMPPGHPFPAGLDDVVTVYKRLLKDQAAKSIALGGISAGGGLTLASTHKFIQLGLEVPGALFAGTPWADLTKTGDSYFTNEGIDRLLVTYDGLLHGAAHLYASGHDLKDPLISPVYGSFHGFPPTYLITGTRDLFLSATARTHRKLRAAGVEADLHVYESQSHGDYFAVMNSPESHEHYTELNAFLLKHLKK
jgi:acetyl esterase/lipase